MADRAWKQTERTIAKRLGGKRLPTSGYQQPDVVTSWLAVEVKHRKALPKWLVDALHQARASASPQQLPVVILHECNHRHADDIVCLRLADFEDWFGAVEEETCTKIET